MEKSFSSLANQTPDSVEESGWTEYLVDFSAYNRGENDQDDIQQESCSLVSSSMVSDAGSGPKWKHRTLNNGVAPEVWSSLGGLPNMPKKLSFKNKRTQNITCDDSLEDTASSPVNSPKITMSFKRMDLNHRKADDNQMGKRTSIDYQVKDKVINDREEVTENLNHDSSGYVQLEKKGLCLVPLSMVIDYLD